MNKHYHQKYKNKYIEKEDIYCPSKTYMYNLFYLSPSNLVGDRDGKWEHYNIYKHALKDPLKYYYNFPPVVVEKRGKNWVFHDGFHRVNFCKKFNLKVPVVEMRPKRSTHIHIYVGLNYSLQERIFNSECKKDLEKPRYPCLYVKCLK